MFGEVPVGLFRVHDWRNGFTTLGEVPSPFIREVSEGKLDWSWPAQVSKLIADGGHDLILSLGQVVPHEVIGMASYNKNVFVGTGPFFIKEWNNAERVVLEAVPNHWRKTAAVKNITMLQVQEKASVLAMLQTGQAAAGAAALKDRPGLLTKGFKELSDGGYEEWVNLSFGGNYWEDKSARTGQPLTRKRDITKPWIGNPFENGPTYDENTKSMQNSLKVRTALSLAMDRAGLAKAIMAGLGRPIYNGYQPSDKTSYFKKGAWPGTGWEIPYDPVKAKQLMVDAGYPNGFTMELWTGPTGVAPELGEAMAGAWEATLGVKTTIGKTTYEAGTRQGLEIGRAHV